jgi:hypothetical protein
MKAGPKPSHNTLKPYWSAFLKHGQQAWTTSSTSPHQPQRPTMQPLSCF